MFTTEKPAQHDAEHALVEALHVAYNCWTEPGIEPLLNQLAGHLFGTVKEGDFEEALEQYVALNSFDGEPLDSLARHYDEDEDPTLRLIRENEILNDLTGAINTLLTIAGHKAATARRVNQLVEALNDTHRQVAA
jgi:hypothetical protein